MMPNATNTWIKITTDLLINFLKGTDSIPAIAKYSIFIHLATINNMITSNYLVYCTSSRLLLFEEEKQLKSSEGTQ